VILAAVALLAAAGAADPWGRPDHLRAVAEPPADWAALAAPRARVRLFWDVDDGPAAVQARVGGGWRTLAAAAEPGWTSRRLPRGVALRVRPASADRWSAPVVAPDRLSPADLARMVSPAPAVLARTVGDLARDPTDGRVWASTLGGGVVELSPAGEVTRSWGAWEGLPHDRVLAVAAADGQALVGTAAGAALLDGAGVARLWDAALPDPYVQAVALEGGRAWAGTVRGLARLDPGAVVPVWADGAVFSVSPASGGGVWAGAGGLRRVAADAPAVAPDGASSPAPHLAGDRVYDAVELFDGGVLAASLERGVWRIGPQGAAARLAGAPPTDTTGLAPTAAGLWVAAGTAGLFGPGGAPVGPGAGLAVGAAWSLSVDPGGRMWVGTDRGLWRLQTRAPSVGAVADGPLVRGVTPAPLSPWPADLRADALWVGDAGAVIGGPEGVRVVGQPRRGASDLVVGASRAVVALVPDDGGLWAVGERSVYLDSRGALDQVVLPERPRDAAAWAGHLWVVAPGGLWRVQRDLHRVELAVPLPEATRVVAGPRGLWVVSRGLVYQVVGGVARPFMRTRTAVSVAPDRGAVWVGTTDGLERIRLGGDDPGSVDDVLGDRDGGVEIPAVALDGAGGCWFAGVDGSVGRVGADGQGRVVHLPGPEPARPTRIVPDGLEHAWVLTRGGTWRVRLPPPSAGPLSR